MKLFFSFIIIFSSFLGYSQKITKVKELKIGNYNYELYQHSFFNYERNIDGTSFSIKLKNKEQLLGTAITYRKTNSSKNYEQKASKELPPDIRSTYKDGIILSEGKIDIDEKNKIITVIESTFIKDNGFENEPDSVKRIYKQKKNGFFEIVFIAEYKNGIEKIISKK